MIHHQAVAPVKGAIEIQGPVPANIEERFVHAVAHATGVEPMAINVIDFHQCYDGIDTVCVGVLSKSVYRIQFEGPPWIVKRIEDESADPNSHFATGSFREFLIARRYQEGGYMYKRVHEMKKLDPHEDATAHEKLAAQADD